jgi:chemotaxis protein methyltransferase CheR
MSEAVLSDQEFGRFRDLLFRSTGISLAPHKKSLVASRLMSRLRVHGLPSYGAYFELATKGGVKGELQKAIDLLTTNETYFYREPKHFDFLRDRILPAGAAQARGEGRPFRIWSAASSSGEEPYTLAFLLADALGVNGQWQILASDISSRVLAKAQRGQYPLERAENVPREVLSKYCLKGVGPADGTFVVDKALRRHITFQAINLNQALPEVGEFDVIFLRNVMIYFELETKRAVVARLLPRLRSGGHIMVSHSETLHGVSDEVTVVQASIYRKP